MCQTENECISTAISTIEDVINKQERAVILFSQYEISLDRINLPKEVPFYNCVTEDEVLAMREECRGIQRALV